MLSWDLQPPMWLQAEFQPRGDVIKGGVRVSVLETFLHIVLLTDSAVANLPRFNKLSIETSL